MKYTAIYLRVSSNHQSIASQIPDLTRWVELNAAGQAVEWYKDSFTGRKMSRPDMDRLLADIEAGTVSRLVVWRMDRLGRTCAGLSKLLSDLQAKGIDFVSLRDGITSLETPAGRLMANILASIAEYETEVRADRVRAGIEKLRHYKHEATKLHQAGRTPEQIAVELGLRLERVRKLLKTGDGLWYGGTARGPKSPTWKGSVTHERVRQLVCLTMPGEDGKQRYLSLEEVAALLKVTRATVASRLRDMGGLLAVRGAPRGGRAGRRKRETAEFEAGVVSLSPLSEAGNDFAGEPE